MASPTGFAALITASGYPIPLAVDRHPILALPHVVPGGVSVGLRTTHPPLREAMQAGKKQVFD